MKPGLSNSKAYTFILHVKFSPHSFICLLFQQTVLTGYYMLEVQYLVLDTKINKMLLGSTH